MKLTTPVKFLFGLAAIFLMPGTILGGLVIEGTLYDGPISTSKLRVEGLASSTWKAPIAASSAELRLLKPGLEKSWPLTPGPQGAFRIETNLPETSIGPFVATVKVGDREYFTGSFGVSPGEKPEIFAYPAGEDHSRVRTITKLVHTIVREKGLFYLKVQCLVEFWNGGDSLYIGSLRNGAREVYRLPIPAGAIIDENRGVAPGTKWKMSSDGKHLVIDEPVVGLADLVAVRHQPGTRGWRVEYRVPASNLFLMSYPLDLAPMTRAEGQMDGFLVFTQEGDMNIKSEEAPEEDPDARLSGASQGLLRRLTELESGAASGVEAFRERTRLLDELFASLRGDMGSQGMKIDPTISKLQKFNNLVEKNPLDGASQSYAVYGPRPEAPLAAGSSLVVPIQISDIAVGQISEKALLWHGGTIAVLLLAVLLGLAFGRSNSGLAGLSQMENLDTLDQIAQLDYLQSTGKIAEKEHHRRRKALLEVAAEELEKDSPAGPGAAALSQSTRKCLEDLRQFDAGPDAAIEAGLDRADLLEGLLKSLEKDMEA